MKTESSDYTDISIYLAGERLYGDDFTISQIRDWYDDEKEAYADISKNNKKSYRYAYHDLNKHYGFSYIRTRYFRNALGLGSAYGCEFEPMIDQIECITIIEPSEKFSKLSEIHGTPCHFKKPNIEGNLDFKNGAFDLITSFGVLHHIPNVTFVLKECFRCLNDGGIMLIREPIVSMGNWNFDRPGLTKRERGIPLHVFQKIIHSVGFSTQRMELCIFPIISKMANRFNVSAYNYKHLTLIDHLLCKLFSRNTTYHRDSFLSKFGPTSVYFILSK